LEFSQRKKTNRECATMKRKKKTRKKWAGHIRAKSRQWDHIWEKEASPNKWAFHWEAKEWPGIRKTTTTNLLGSSHERRREMPTNAHRKPRGGGGHKADWDENASLGLTKAWVGEITNGEQRGCMATNEIELVSNEKRGGESRSQRLEGKNEEMSSLIPKETGRTFPVGSRGNKGSP